MVKLQTAPVEAETPSAEAETVPARFAVAPTIIPEKLIKLITPSLVKSWIYCQVFFSKQRMSSTWHHLAVSATSKSQNFFFWLKNKRSLTLLKFFPYLLFSPSTKFWSSCIAWLYIRRTKLHTKGGSLSDPLLADLHSPFLISVLSDPTLSLIFNNSKNPFILLPYL